MTILALDYGDQRVGVAISRVGLAEPLSVLPNDEQLFANIRQICEQEKVEVVLLGLSEKETAEKTKKFGQKLTDFLTGLDLEIIYTDETLSSKQARMKLAQAQTKQSKRFGPIDHYAAAVFLQEWLG